MTDRAGEIVQHGRELLTEIHGEAPSEETLARFLAAQIMHACDGFCFGYGRHGRPSARAPKAPFVAVDVMATGQADD